MGMQNCAAYTLPAVWKVQLLQDLLHLGGFQETSVIQAVAKDPSSCQVGDVVALVGPSRTILHLESQE